MPVTQTTYRLPSCVSSGTEAASTCTHTETLTVWKIHQCSGVFRRESGTCMSPFINGFSWEKGSQNLWHRPRGVREAERVGLAHSWRCSSASRLHPEVAVQPRSMHIFSVYAMAEEVAYADLTIQQATSGSRLPCSCEHKCQDSSKCYIYSLLVFKKIFVVQYH